MAAKWDDHYTKRARDEGYPARSVFKLQEIQRRFRIVPRGGRVLDVGASPGSWSLFVLKELGAHVMAVDLQPLNLDGDWGGRLGFLQGDIYDPEVIDRIRHTGPYQAVISDAAPATRGHRLTDAVASANLVRQVITLACDSLEPGGNLVAKILQGGDEQELLSILRGFFGKARAFKPDASRRASSEMFLLGLGYKGKQSTNEIQKKP